MSSSRDAKFYESVESTIEDVGNGSRLLVGGKTTRNLLEGH